MLNQIERKIKETNADKPISYQRFSFIQLTTSWVSTRLSFGSHKSERILNFSKHMKEQSIAVQQDPTAYILVTHYLV